MSCRFEQVLKKHPLNAMLVAGDLVIKDCVGFTLYRKEESMGVHGLQFVALCTTVIFMRRRPEKSNTKCTFVNDVNILHTVSLMVSL